MNFSLHASGTRDETFGTIDLSRTCFRVRFHFRLRSARSRGEKTSPLILFKTAPSSLLVMGTLIERGSILIKDGKIADSGWLRNKVPAGAKG